MKTFFSFFVKTAFVFTLTFLSFLKSEAQLLNGKKMVVPEFCNHTVKLYQQNGTMNIVENVNYRLDLISLLSPLGCNQPKPNAVTIHNENLYVAVDGSSCQRIYEFPQYLTNPTFAKANIKLITNQGSGYVGIIFDKLGNLYATEGAFENNRLVRYDAPGYTNKTDLGNAGVQSYFGNLAFDSSDNLWVSDYKNNRIIVFNGPSLNINNYHILNTLNGSLPVATVNINTPSNSLFSKPEGLAFDKNGNLWIANNNDRGTNSRTSLVKILPALQAIVLGTPPSGNINPTNGTFEIYNIPNPTQFFANCLVGMPNKAQLGGLQIDKSAGRIFVNEQAGNKGLWFDLANLSNINDNYAPYQLNISSTNAGNGGFFLADVPDLYSKDSNADTGDEPNLATTHLYESNDIWVRNMNDGRVNQSHENAQYSTTNNNNRNYVYVRIRNRGAVASAGTENISLYRAKASTGLGWVSPWQNNNNDGGLIGTVTIPSIVPGDEYIAEIPWDIIKEPGHFCLLSRITTSDPVLNGMSFAEQTGRFDGEMALNNNVRNNNNIAWKNITVVEVTPMIGNPPNGFRIIAANYTSKAITAKLGFELLNSEGKQMPFGNARLTIKAEGAALKKLLNTEFNQKFVQTQEDGSFKINDLKEGLTNIHLAPNETVPLTVTFEPENKIKDYALRVVQYVKDSTGNFQVMGGQTFVAGKVNGFNTNPNQQNGFSLPWWAWLLILSFLLVLIWRYFIKK